MSYPAQDKFLGCYKCPLCLNIMPFGTRADKHGHCYRCAKIYSLRTK